MSMHAWHWDLLLPRRCVPLASHFKENIAFRAQNRLPENKATGRCCILFKVLPELTDSTDSDTESALGHGRHKLPCEQPPLLHCSHQSKLSLCGNDIVINK